MKKVISSFIALLLTFATANAQSTVGAFFSFQDAASQNAANGAGTYSEAVSVNTFTVAPTFSATGIVAGGYGNFGNAFTAFNGSSWGAAKSVGWDTTVTSTNTWQVTLNTTGVKVLDTRFTYRLNGVQSGGANVTALSAFEYKIGSGSWVSVPGISLTLLNNTSYNNTWTADLSSVTAINNQSAVTLRWSFPAFTQTATSLNVRMDNLQITGTYATPFVRARALPEGNYNVLFVAFDDLKANFGPFQTPEQAAVMPKPVTPHLDSLAASGMAFTRAYCQQAVCWASRASLLTGCRPDTTKIWDQIELSQDTLNFRTTMPGIITLPQHFANMGYNVAGFGKIYDQRGTPPNYDSSLSWPGGMDTSSFPGRYYYEDGHFQAENAAATNKSKLFITDKGEFKDPTATVKVPINKDTDYSDSIMTGKAITKLNTYAATYTSSSKPFFLAIGYSKPHLPCVSPKQFWDLYDPTQINLSGYTGSRTFPTGTLQFTGANYEINTFLDIGANTITNINKARNLIHGYLAATSYADDQLGRVLAALNANPAVAAKTIIVVWGDHGWHLGDHNGFWAKHSCYEEAARAPLIITAPGMSALGTAGKTCQSPVEFVDIFPTLVDLASQPEPAQPVGLELQGISLRGLLEDPAQPWKKAAFTQYQRSINGTGIANTGDGMGYSIRTRRYRYTEWWRTQTTKDANGYSITRDVKLYSTPEYKELYDMIADPNQTVNLAAKSAYASLVTELSAALAGGYGWQTSSVAPPTNFPTTYNDWKASHVEPGYPISLFAEAMDPDSDGVLNLREYAHGTNPLAPNVNPAWSEVTGPPGAEYLSLEFPRVGARTDVTTTATASTDLSYWAPTGVITENLGTQANTTLWRSKISKSGSAPSKGFLRLEFVK
ncbi:MAG: sulfatase [Akkermansiaceae bacterium]|nr:sulfatase [Akkermansiaceae bacterium]